MIFFWENAKKWRHPYRKKFEWIKSIIVVSMKSCRRVYVECVPLSIQRLWKFPSVKMLFEASSHVTMCAGGACWPKAFFTSPPIWLCNYVWRHISFSIYLENNAWPICMHSKRGLSLRSFCSLDITPCISKNTYCYKILKDL